MAYQKLQASRASIVTPSDTVPSRLQPVQRNQTSGDMKWKRQAGFEYDHSRDLWCIWTSRPDAGRN